jgi:hypothetical protein
LQPFKRGGIRFPDELQYFPYVPAVHIQFSIDGETEIVGLVHDGQVVPLGSYVYKPDIVIAVRGWKLPSPAAGFAGKQQFDAVCLLYTGEYLSYGRFHVLLF